MLAMNNKNELHAKLKMLILAEVETHDASTDRYRAISEDIFSKTKNYISKTTITRYLETEDSSAFSPFVLNSLIEYLGFSSWIDFSKSDVVNNLEVIFRNNKDDL